MGNFRFGPPRDFILHLKERYAIESFVETGTYRAETARWAATRFRRVYTIESSEVLYQANVRAYGGTSNLSFIQGDSRSELARLSVSLDGPALFWLDGHWCEGATSGQDDQCPLLDELTILNQFPHESFILIDDARMFLCTPPEPFAIEQWPGISEVIATLERGPARFIFVFEDVLFAVPERHKDEVRAYLHQLNTRLGKHVILGALKKLAGGLLLMGKTAVGRALERR